MARYAVVRTQTGLVENITEWDGKTTWSSPVGCNAVQSDVANIGDIWDGTKFTTPVAVVAIPDLLTATILAPTFVPGTLTNVQRDQAIQALMKR